MTPRNAAAAAVALDGDAFPTRTHRQSVTAARHRYTVRVDGTADGESARDPVGYGHWGQAWENNLSLRLENTGDTAVVNPRLVVNGRRRWHSVPAILGEVLAPGMTDAEKARAIWEFARRHRYHATTGDDEVKDTVKMLNVYGYTLCWDEAYTVSNLWQAAGLPIRRGVPHGHCTTEVWFDGAWHLLDSDEHLLVLGRDNRTIVGEADIARDHDLMKRAHAYGILSREDRATSEGAAALFTHVGPHAGGRPRIGGHTMDLALRPGEALVWEWEPGGKYHGHGGPPPRYANGRHEYRPRLDATFARWATSVRNLQVAPASSGLVPGEPGAPCAITYAVESPYVLVGGRLRVRLGPGSGAVRVEVAGGPRRSRQSSPGQPGAAVSASAVAAAALGPGACELDLDPHFPHDAPAAYQCRVRLSGTLALESIEIALDVQMAPLSLPGLGVGDNVVEYEDESVEPREVRITHQWRERDDLQAPPAPRLQGPADAAAVTGTQVAFAWEPVPGAADYHLRVGETPDLKWVVSPTFEKLTSRSASRGRPTWQVPEEGLLNPGQTYYWHVRARSAEGLWGPWSAGRSFTPRAPGVPLEVRCLTDWEARTVRLCWQPNPSGTTPVRYEVHASDERGFTARREPYPVVVGGDQGTAAFPGNLLAEVAGCQPLVLGRRAGSATGTDAATRRAAGSTGSTAPPSHRPVEAPGAAAVDGRCFYRVVAVDAAGARSGPSDYAEAPRPFVHSPPPVRIRAGQTTTYAMRATRSAGDLRCVSRGPHRYLSAFRDADTLCFILDEGPDFIELDSATGLMALRPEPSHVGVHTVTVRVQNGQGGTDVQGFDLEVVP
ncbi:MAG: hypothetical protein ABIL09_04305 [Gemmatimonadota bacterium]